MNLAEKLIIRARNFWLKKHGVLLPNPAQTVLIKKWNAMLEDDKFKQDAAKLSKYKLSRSLIKSARHSVGKMIVDLNKG